MRSIRLFTSNRMEKLAEALAVVLAAPLGDPLAPETVIVPNRGVARWLSLYLADNLGVCANFKFSYPEAFIEKSTRALLPELPAATPFSRDLLLWRIFGELKRSRSLRGFEEVERYLASSRDEEGNLFGLSSRLTNLFELYQVFRPGMLLAWERGVDDGWQSHLWRPLLYAY